MNTGLVRKAARELLVLAFVVAVGLGAVEFLFARLLPSFYTELSTTMLRIPFIRGVFAALLGIDASSEIGPGAFLAIVWTHPVVLALLWTLAVTAGTRTPAGEIDRGTVDVLLSLPVSRAQVLVADAVVAAACGLVAVMLAFVGNLAGGWSLAPEVFGSTQQRLWVCLNLWSLYLAVFGLSSFASACSDRRGRAVGVAVGFLVASLLLNFLGPFNETVRRLSFLTLLEYHRPIFVLQQGKVPLGDILILLAFGLIFWLVSAVIFATRDIRTV